MTRQFGLMAGAVISSMLLFTPMAPADAATKACGADVHRRLQAKVTKNTKAVAIDCDLTLKKGDVIAVPLSFTGSAGSGRVLDCNGATLDGTVPSAMTVLIRSKRQPDGSWEAPRDITIRNCTIKGGLHIRGLGRNGEAENVRQSSLTPGHTERAQAAAPRDIRIENVTFVAQGGIPLYAAPGVTGLVVENSTFTGKSGSVGIYLDAESARNQIRGNVFDIRTTVREVLAVDGSADNRIEGNRFENPIGGGIFLYRNCGEGGTIRHQAPQRNVIKDNTFRYSTTVGARPAIWLGSRQGNRFYCLYRTRGAFGSGLSPRDFAQNNVVTGNRLNGASLSLILDQDENNTVTDNR